MSTNIDSDTVLQIRTQVQELATLLEQQVPGFPTMLARIHKELVVNPEVIQILSPEERSLIVRGMMKVTQTVILEEKAATKKREIKKAIKQPGLGLEDLI